MTDNKKPKLESMNQSPSNVHVLLTGASGYLGQHLIQYWLREGPPKGLESLQITALYHSATGFPKAVQDQISSSSIAVYSSKVSIRFESCDLGNGELPSSISKSTDSTEGAVVCIHTAAMSSPRACQQDPTKAKALNIPTKLFDSLAQNNIPMIALSTDQVYDGRKSKSSTEEDTKQMKKLSLYSEDDDTPSPINVYAETKWEMERYLQSLAVRGGSKSILPKIVLLRSSIILGPKAPFGCQAHDTFFHFVQSRDQKETSFYTNEYRTVVSVLHVCRILSWLTHSIVSSSSSSTRTANTKDDESPECQVYNMGGPHRVHRLDMAKAVFDHFGYSHEFLKESKQTAPTVPLDISMNSQKLQLLTGITHEPTTLKGLVEHVFSDN